MLLAASHIICQPADINGEKINKTVHRQQQPTIYTVLWAFNDEIIISQINFFSLAHTIMKIWWHVDENLIGGWINYLLCLVAKFGHWFYCTVCYCFNEMRSQIIFSKSMLAKWWSWKVSDTVVLAGLLVVLKINRYHANFIIIDQCQWLLKFEFSSLEGHLRSLVVIPHKCTKLSHIAERKFSLGYKFM